MVFIKLRDDLNGKEAVHRFFALNFNAFNQITTFWKIVSFQRLERSIPLCYQKMAQTMRFDVFKVSFHPFNLVNHWERFQCCFAALLFLTVQSVMIVLKKKKKKKLDVGVWRKDAGFTPTSGSVPPSDLCFSVLGAEEVVCFNTVFEEVCIKPKKCKNVPSRTFRESFKTSLVTLYLLWYL